MGAKVFIDIESADIKLVGDESDIMLPLSIYGQVQAWCRENNIIAKMAPEHPFMQTMFGVTLWRVQNEQHRTLFMLKWYDANSNC